MFGGWGLGSAEGGIPEQAEAISGSRVANFAVLLISAWKMSESRVPGSNGLMG